VPRGGRETGEREGPRSGGRQRRAKDAVGHGRWATWRCVSDMRDRWHRGPVAAARVREREKSGAVR
jgi:hypothetical protein